MSNNSSYLRLTPDKGKRIRIYRNGDVHHKGINIVLNSRQTHDINAFLDAVSEKIGLVLGAKRLFTLDGTQINSTQQLEHNKEYVASSGPFTLLPYGKLASLRVTPSVGRQSTSSVAGLQRSKASDSFAMSSASKKSAPPSLAHPTIRQSRSTEPMRQQREKSEANNNLSRKASNKKGKETATNGDKKRRGKAIKQNEEEATSTESSALTESFPPPACPLPVLPATHDEPQEGEGAEEIHPDSDEIIEHNDAEEEQNRGGQAHNEKEEEIDEEVREPSPEDHEDNAEERAATPDDAGEEHEHGKDGEAGEEKKDE